MAFFLFFESLMLFSSWPMSLAGTQYNVEQNRQKWACLPFPHEWGKQSVLCHYLCCYRRSYRCLCCSYVINLIILICSNHTLIRYLLVPSKKKKKKSPKPRWVSRRMNVPWQPAFCVYRDRGGTALKAMAVLHS